MDQQPIPIIQGSPLAAQYGQPDGQMPSMTNAVAPSSGGQSATAPPRPCQIMPVVGNEATVSMPPLTKVLYMQPKLQNYRQQAATMQAAEDAQLALDAASTPPGSVVCVNDIGKAAISSQENKNVIYNHRNLDQPCYQHCCVGAAGFISHKVRVSAYADGKGGGGKGARFSLNFFFLLYIDNIATKYSADN